VHFAEYKFAENDAVVVVEFCQFVATGLR